MGILGRLSVGWDLAISSWKVIWHNKSLMIFPLLALMAQVCVIALYSVGGDVLGIMPALQKASEAGATLEDKASGYGMIFLIYMVFNTITIYFNVALISCTGRALSGRAASPLRGLWDATSRMPYILVWAAVSSTVALLLNMLEQHKKIGKLVKIILGSIWCVLTYLVLPVMVFEQVNPFRAIGRSKELIFKNWGENLGGRIGTGVLAFVLILPAIGLMVVAMVIEMPLLILVACAWFFLVLLWNATANSVLTVAVYAYANHKDLKTDYFKDLGAMFYRGDGRGTLDPQRSRMDNKLRDKSGATQLHRAAAEGQLYVVQAMLRRGANSHAQDSQGHTAYDIAVEKGHTDIAQLLERHMEETENEEREFNF